MRAHITLIVALLMASFKSYGTWYVARQVSLPQLDAPQVTLTYLSPVEKTTLPGYFGSGTVYLSTGCINENVATDPHYTWDYVSFPEKVYITTLSYIHLELDSASANGWIDRGTVNNMKRFAKQLTRDWSWGGGCESVGGGNAGDTWKRPAVSLQATLFDGGDLQPQQYQVTTGVRSAQIAATSDAASMAQALASADVIVPNAASAESPWVIVANIVPRCSVDSLSIELSHGSISAADVEGNRTPELPINMRCQIPTNVTLTLKGSDPVSGYDSNATNCKNGTVCQVYIGSESGGYNSVVAYQNAQFINLKIYSVLHKFGKITEGEFSGSAVLEIKYN